MVERHVLDDRCAFLGVPEDLVAFEHSRVTWTARDSGADVLLEELEEKLSLASVTPSGQEFAW